MFYRSLATSSFLHQTSDFPCRHYRALSTQSLFASHIAQELSGRFTAHSFLRPGIIEGIGFSPLIIAEVNRLYNKRHRYLAVDHRRSEPSV